jgi:hypothetical protein
MEKRATNVSRIPNGIRGSYNVNRKLMLMNHAKITNSCNATNKFQVSRETIRIWRLNIRRNTKSTQKYFSGQKHSHCQELEQEIVQFMYLRNVQLPYNPYPTSFPYGNGMVLHFYQQQESSTTKTVHKVINKRLKAYV